MPSAITRPVGSHVFVGKGLVAETPGSGDGGVPGTCVPLLKKLRDR